MAKSKGRVGVILVGMADPPVTPVAHHKDASFDQTKVDADTTTNDSGADEEHEIIRKGGQLTFNVLTDPDDPGQNILRDGYEQDEKIYVEWQPHGTGGGKRYYRFRCSVSLKRGTPRDGMATTDVTLKKDGAATIGNQGA